jgi:carboxynorspermidine decarboxylase
VVDETRLAANLDVLDFVQRRCGVKILLALKGFAMFSVFPLLRNVLYGTSASSPYEARLGREEFGGEVHCFAAGYTDRDMEDLVSLADHLIFNSFTQYRRFRPMMDRAAREGRHISRGIRINPEHSEGTVSLYNPCAPGSRLGVRPDAFAREAASGGMDGIDGLHFHTLCQQNSDALERTLAAVERAFGGYMEGISWINFGGGHHITRPDYDVERLCRLIETFRKRRSGLSVYLEPGEAVALNAGILKSTVLDLVAADMPIAVLDCSTPAHMPDVLEMPYRPDVLGAGFPGEKAWTCRLAGKSCLAGDVMGEYSFDMPLKEGDSLLFLDMAHYSMVKTTTFNGLTLPAIARITPDGRVVPVKIFRYEDFKERLS